MKFPTIEIHKLNTWEDNPREIDSKQFDRLVDSLLTFPKMLFELRPVVIDAEMKVRGGNQRLNALTKIAEFDEQGITTRLNSQKTYTDKSDEEREQIINFWLEWLKNPNVPYIEAKDMSEQELREFVIKDNVAGGKWDYDVLANEWDSSLLNEWGLDVWDGAACDISSFFDENNVEEKPKKLTITVEMGEDKADILTEVKSAIKDLISAYDGVKIK